ncbi:MAG: hypothetical protein H6838_04635 [Planctomycetes bacterium]|nr:hypothetical protein [Planctomycetota bacterium]MCB9884754.1 hypothetical protein [Planctomycetota bacterium]
MPLPSARVWPLVGLLLVGCSHSSSSGIGELANAVIGPDGGELRIESGPQAGLVLTVPPGALSDEVTLRIVQIVPQPLPPGTAALEVTPPGRPFRLEPIGVQFQTAATLRLPFVPEALQYVCGLGNVRVRQQSAAASWEREPAVIDVPGHFVETTLLTGGQLQVVQGPRPTSFYDYFPARDTVVALDNGGLFRCETIADARFPARDLYRWRLTLDPLYRDFGYVLESAAFVGRESFDDDWLEMWAGQHLSVTQLKTISEGYMYGPNMTTAVYRPAATGLSLAGTAQLRTAWRFREPMVIAGQRVLDVLELRVDVAWNRSDIATGHEEMIFWFAPGHGLLGLRDGTADYLRTSL